MPACFVPASAVGTAFRRLGLRGIAGRLSTAAARAASEIFTTTGGPAPAGSSAPDAVESLEGRRLLSSVTLVNGVLNVIGDSGKLNELVVQPSGSSSLYAYANNVNKKLTRSQVKAVRFVGGARDDEIFLASSLNVPSTVLAGAGNDEVRLAGGNDVVDAGDGNDLVWSQGGNDVVVGGPGNDSFKGDTGNDTFDGGSGDDVAYGEEGTDTLRGGDGVDKLYGGPDNDTLDGGAGSDVIDGGPGNDTLNFQSDDRSPYGAPPPASKPDAPDKPDKPDVPADKPGTGGDDGKDDDDGTPPPATPGTGVDQGSGNVTVYGKAIDSSTPRPVINLMGKSGFGPHAVHVHALGTTLNGGSAITARYQWNFGDPKGRFNTLDGWNAAHLYEQPGTYTVTLTVTNENGRRNAVSTTVTVAADNRRTIYVDAEAGRDTNTGLSASTPIKTLNRLQDLVASNTRVLFKRGQRFTFERGLSIPYQNVFVGAYGSGADPVIYRVRGVEGSAIATYNQSKQVVISGLTFDSPYAARGGSAPMISVDGVNPRGTNITVKGCTFLNLDNAVAAEGDPRGLLVLDNKAPLATGLRMYFVWSEGSDHVFLGNEVANSTRQHVIRSSGTTRMLIAGNDLTNLDRSGVDGPDFSKGVVEIHRGSYAYVAGNEVHDGALRAGPRGGGQEDDDTSTEWVVFENNLVVEHDIAVYPGTHHLMVRNNIIRSDTSAAVTVQPADSEGRVVADIHILNNTGVSTTDRGRFLLVTGELRTAAITLKNNMFVATKHVAGKGGAPIYVTDTDLSAFKEISHNVWPVPIKFDKYAEGGLNYVWPYWSDSRGYQTYAEWDKWAVVSDEKYDNSALDSDLRPRKGTVASTAAEVVKGVYTDFFGRTRPAGGAWSAGAVQTA